MGEFLSIVLDTVRGKLTLTEAKLLKLMLNLQVALAWEEA